MKQYKREITLYESSILAFNGKIDLQHTFEDASKMANMFSKVPETTINGENHIYHTAIPVPALQAIDPTKGWIVTNRFDPRVIQGRSIHGI